MDKHFSLLVQSVTGEVKKFLTFDTRLVWIITMPSLMIWDQDYKTFSEQLQASVFYPGTYLHPRRAGAYPGGAQKMFFVKHKFPTLNFVWNTKWSILGQTHSQKLDLGKKLARAGSTNWRESSLQLTSLLN